MVEEINIPDELSNIIKDMFDYTDDISEGTTFSLEDMFFQKADNNTLYITLENAEGIKISLTLRKQDEEYSGLYKVQGSIADVSTALLILELLEPEIELYEGLFGHITDNITQYKNS